MASKRISFRVHGKVQGVFFRQFTIEMAKAYGLTGWVRNCENGDVQGEAQGDAESLGKLVRDLKQGPSAAKVENVDEQALEGLRQGESSFEQAL